MFAVYLRLPLQQFDTMLRFCVPAAVNSRLQKAHHRRRCRRVARAHTHTHTHTHTHLQQIVSEEGQLPVRVERAAVERERRQCEVVDDDDDEDGDPHQRRACSTTCMRPRQSGFTLNASLNKSSGLAAQTPIASRAHLVPCAQQGSDGLITASSTKCATGNQRPQLVPTLDLLDLLR